MKKLERRAVLCLLLVVVLVAGLIFFIFKLEKNGGTWASFYANEHVYSHGNLCVGAVYDRNGKLLLKNTKQGPEYNDDSQIRKATFHCVGDQGNNVATGAVTAFKSKMIGYNFVTGTAGLLKNSGRKIYLTIDAQINRTAYEALAGRKGYVAVYNWKSGDIVCMVSTPTMDQTSSNDGNVESGTYINKVLSACFTPGSTFKLVTTAAAIDNMEDLNAWQFTCTGSFEIEGEKVTCKYPHGTVDLYGALAKSCNCAYASLTTELGSDVMNEYVKKLGLTDSYSVNGIKTKAGSFDFEDAKINLGWAGIGQYKDQVNPLSMMVYVGAIAGNGTAAKPEILAGSTVIEKGLSKMKERGAGGISLLSEGTALQIREMMRNNVVETYGDNNFPGLELHAKSGTAEVGKGLPPNALFVGFSGDYAFAVCVESGGAGATAAGPVANKVLQDMKAAGYLS